MTDYVRYPHTIRLLVALAQGRNSTFLDNVEKILAPLSNDEVMALVYGEVDEMRTVVTKYKIPNTVLDFIGMMIDGESISSFVEPPKECDIPPKKIMH